MINIIKVKCPHCGVEGQLIVPETDLIIVGPCPECNNTVVIFAGRALPLDTALMSQATKEEAYAHLYKTLKKFVRERLDQLFNAPVAGANDAQEAAAESGEKHTDQGGQHQEMSISPQEMHEFISRELHLIDNPSYFKSIFG